MFQNQEVMKSTLFKAPPDNAEKSTHTAKHTAAYSLGNLTHGDEGCSKGGLRLGRILSVLASPVPALDLHIHPSASGKPNQAVTVTLLYSL